VMRPCLVAKSSQVGVGVNVLSCLLRHPTAMDASLEYGVLGLGRFFIAWLPRLSLEESLPLRVHMPRLSGWGQGPCTDVT
jgi:hypothetical protein